MPQPWGASGQETPETGGETTNLRTSHNDEILEIYADVIGHGGLIRTHFILPYAFSDAV